MPKAEKTKQFIIEKTATLFNTKGYISTSLSDIANATGLTKGSIYGNFENKDAVALEVYRYNSGKLGKSLAKTLSSEFPGALEKLYAFVDFYRQNWHFVFSSGGCPLMNAATESDDTFPHLKNQVKKSFKGWISELSEIIELGQSNGEFNTNINPDHYASLIIMLTEGGILLSKTIDEESYLNLALDRILHIIDTEIKSI